MGEKEKSKRGKHFGIAKSCLIFSLYPIFILLILNIGFIYWAFGGYVKSSLDPEYLPTAEYLLLHPIEIPETDWQTGLNIRFSENMSFDDTLWFIVSSMEMDDFENLQWAEIYINEQVVSRVQLSVPSGIHHTMPMDTAFYVRGQLNSGIHVIEFRAKTNPFAEPYYIHRWAIEIP